MNPAAIDFSHSAFNCSTDSMQIRSSPSSVDQIGIGIPQYLERDKFQSFAFSSHFPKRPVPVDSGFHWMVLFNSTMRSFLSVTRMNHESSG